MRHESKVLGEEEEREERNGVKRERERERRKEDLGSEGEKTGRVGARKED